MPYGTIVVVLSVLLWFAGTAAAQDDDELPQVTLEGDLVKLPDARLEFESYSFGILLGFSHGEGVLTYDGDSYPFSIKGLNGLTLGASTVSALGLVYDLEDIADFPGKYLAVQGDFTLIQGGGSALLRNDQGVLIEVQT